MDCLDCCPCWKRGYEAIPTTVSENSIDAETHATPAKTPPRSVPPLSMDRHKTPEVESTRTTGEAPKSAQRAATPKSSTSEFDIHSPVFQGCEVLQKFNNNTSYNKRFVWLNSASRTIHMSQHMTKERRHKEASLLDVTSVVAGPPVKRKTQPATDISDMCLTVNFKRGGGIDLQFKSMKERDLWYDTLTKLVALGDMVEA